MEKCIIKLPVVSHRTHHLFTIRLNKIHHIDILGVSINYPVKAIESVKSAIASLSVGVHCKQHPVIRAE